VNHFLIPGPQAPSLAKAPPLPLGGGGAKVRGPGVGVPQGPPPKLGPESFGFCFS